MFAQPCVTPPAGMVGWWRGESNGVDVIAGNNGSVQNAGYTTGVVGEAFAFDPEIDGYSVYTGLQIADQPQYQLTNLTIEGWARPRTNQYVIQGAPTFIVFDRSSYFGYMEIAYRLVMDNNGGLSFLITETSRAQAAVQCSLQYGQWYHLAATFDGASGTMSLYTNGVLAAQTNTAFPPITDIGSVNAGIGIGNYNDTYSYPFAFCGDIDEIALYARALSQAEIAGIYAAGSSGKCNVPVAPTIITSMQGTTVAAASNTTLSLVVGGSVPFGYQWSSNSVLIPNATNSTLTISNTQFSQSNTLFTVVVSNAAGAVTNSGVLSVVPVPTISSIGTQGGPLNTVLGPVSFTVFDPVDQPSNLVFTIASSATNIVPVSGIVLGGSGTNLTVTIYPATNAIGSAGITISFADSWGASASASFQAVYNGFTPVGTGIPHLTYSAVAAGDYDNDGKLDLLVTGTTNGLASGAICRLYHNDRGVFSNFLSFPGVFRGAVAWGDYDNDGRLDFVVTGLTTNSNIVSRIYHNNGDGTFSNLNASLTGVYAGSVAWGDFNNDGRPDLVFTGLGTNLYALNAVTSLVKLFRNDGNGVFTDLQTLDISAGTNGTACWGDYDNDGKLDLLVCLATNPTNYNNATTNRIYRNAGNGVFVQAYGWYSPDYNYNPINSVYPGTWFDYNNDGLLDAVFQDGTFGDDFRIFKNSGPTNYFFNAPNNFYNSYGNGPCAFVCGDFNNDGFADFVLAGNGATLFTNGANLYPYPYPVFNNLPFAIPNSTNGSICAGDFNTDGTLDLFYTGGAGNSSILYNSWTPNTPPTAPASPAAISLNDVNGFGSNSVVFTWTRSTDAQTSSNGLNYNLRVGTSPGGVDILSPMADPATGQRRLAAMGNAGTTNSAMLINLPAGTYYWAVQAIDPGFAGSPFSSESTFVISNHPPNISAISNWSLAPTVPFTLPFTVGDLETPASNLVLSARSSNTNVQAATNFVFGGSGSNRTVTFAPNAIGSGLVTITVADAQGASASSSFAITVSALALVQTNFNASQFGFLAWADYNNDGLMDVLIAGYTNTAILNSVPASPLPVTQLYKNNGNGTFTPVPSGLPGVSQGSAAWGDFDNDGYLDLAITGATNGLTNSGICRIYHNNGNGTFTDIKAGLPNIYGGSVVWADLDNDGRLDLVVSGATNGAYYGVTTRIYHNNGDGTFTNIFTFTNLGMATVACADLNGDGLVDLIISASLSGSQIGTRIYKNNGSNAFSLVNSIYPYWPAQAPCPLAIGDFDADGLPDIMLSAGYSDDLFHNLGNFVFSDLGYPAGNLDEDTIAAWGDFDNDGRPDMLISGQLSDEGLYTYILRNNGNLTLSNYPAELPVFYHASAAWVDYDNDGRLDLMLSGTTWWNAGSVARTYLYRNLVEYTNNPPTAPTGLTAVRSNNVINLSWAQSQDAQTTSNALTYQLRVGTNSGGIQIASPGANLGTGFRRAVQAGPVTTNQTQLNLPPGTYYWSVQAVDSAYAGSPFASEGMFTMSPVPVAGPCTAWTVLNLPATFPATNLLVNDTGGDPGGLAVSSLGQPSVSGSSAILSAGSVMYFPATNFVGTDTFTYSISDGSGGVATGLVTMNVLGSAALMPRLVYGPVFQNGNFKVSFAGVPGFAYTVQTAASVAGPWTKVLNLTAPTFDAGFGIGGFGFSASTGTNAMQFFRTVYPAY